MTDLSLELIPKDELREWLERVLELQDQRDRVVRALAQMCENPHPLYPPHDDLLDEDWAREVLAENQ